MADGFRILNGAKTRKADVPSGGNAQQVLAMDGQGSPLFKLDGSVYTLASSRGLLRAARDYRDVKIGRLSSDGTRQNSSSQCLFYDMIEASLTVPDPQKWTFITSMTSGQSIGTGFRFNTAGLSSGAAVYVTHRSFPVTGRSMLVFRTKVRHTLPNLGPWIYESGLGNPVNSAAVTVVNGAHWRRDSQGDYTPVVVMKSLELLGKTVPQATLVAALADPKNAPPLYNPAAGTYASQANYFYQEVAIEDGRAYFRLISQSGVVIHAQVVEFGEFWDANNNLYMGNFSASHLRAFHRSYTTTQSGPGYAGDFFVAQTSVWLLDRMGPDYQSNQSNQGLGSLFAPSPGDIALNVQLASYANSAAPTVSVINNTSRQYTSYGGQWAVSTNTGAETDGLFCALQFPTYAFVITRVSISAWTTVASTGAVVYQWGLGFNSGASSLANGAPNPYMRKTIGCHSWSATAAVGASGGPDVVWEGRETIQPSGTQSQSGYFAVILKIPIGPGSGIAGRGTISVDGYFE